MSSPNADGYMQNAAWSFEKIALTSVLSGNRKRKDPSRRVVRDSMEPSGDLSVRNGGSGIKYGKLQDLRSSCSNQVWFSGVVKSSVVLAKFKMSTQILGLLYSWGKLTQKSFHIYNFLFIFPKMDGCI